jgi:4-hydroxy-2-oxoheptanedioate aldolase
VHGVLLCQAESADAVRAFVEACRYPHLTAGVDPALPSPAARLHGAVRPAGQPLGIGTRGRGSEATAAPIWDLSAEEYLDRCDPWPLNPTGELLLGVKLESPEGIAQCERILEVPGIGFAELGPGDLGLALGHRSVPREPYPREMLEARERVFASCRKHRVPFLETCNPENIVGKLDEGVRVVAGHREETARIGRAHQRREMPV